MHSVTPNFFPTPCLTQNNDLQPSRSNAWAALVLLSSVLLASCGGGSGSSSSASAEPWIAEVTGPGAVVSAEPLASFPVQYFRDGLASQNAGVANAKPQYDVKAWRIRYLTLDAAGQTVEASGLLGIPVKALNATSPVLSYQHGTIFKDAQAPSNNLAATEPTLLMASMGYLAVAPDYVGYGASKGKEHPYLQATPTAHAVVDLLTASRIWRQKQGYLGNGQLFLLGYSEGGHATVAAHRQLQSDNSIHSAQLVQSLAGAGPYHVGETLNTLLLRVRDQNPLLGGLLSPGLLKNLGATVRNEVRRQLVKALIPADADVIINTNFIDDFLADDTAALDRDFNVHDWAPKQSLLLYHGKDDQTVPYSASTRTLQTMQSRGATTVTLTPCPATPAGHLECVPSFFDFALSQLKVSARDL